MSKRKERLIRQDLFERVVGISTRSPRIEPDQSEDEDTLSGHGDAPISDTVLASSPDLARVLMTSPDAKRELTKMKKFRFQLLHQWIVNNTEPCRMADIGGGKGLLAYLLNQSGWQGTVIDPIHQGLPTKYKDIPTNRQIRIAETETVPRRDQPFAPEMAQDFDLLVAMHAHGCNIQMLDSAAQYQRSVIVLPCCIINEPLRPTVGTHWLQCVADYAKQKGFVIEPFRLNFKGQNIGLYARCN